MSYGKMDKYAREYIRRYGYKGYVVYDGHNRPTPLRARTLDGARIECIRDILLDSDGIGVYKVTDDGIVFCGEMSRTNGRYKYAAGNHWEPAGSYKSYLVDPNTGRLVSDAKIDRTWDGSRRAMKLRY